MKKKKNKIPAIVTAVFVAFAAIAGYLPGNMLVRAAEATVVSDVATLVKLFSDVLEVETEMSLQLGADLTVSSEEYPNGLTLNVPQYGSFTLDLAGHSITTDGFGSTTPLFSLSYSNSKLTINDSSAEGKGVISTPGGVAVSATDGTLVINGGSFTGAAQTLMVSGTANVSITGGNFVTNKNGETDVALKIDGGKSIAISGGTFDSAYVTVWVTENATEFTPALDISGGTFTVSKGGSFGYACGIYGSCNLTISGGTFNLNATAGSSLVLGLAASDELISISGGTYNGRIARAMPKDSTSISYELFYGAEYAETGGIMAPGYVLTDNTFTNEADYSYGFTQDRVSVVEGTLICFDTGRSNLETLPADETVTAYDVDYYSLDPVSVGTGKVIYSNTESTIIPSVDSSRVENGNTYTFYKWYDETETGFDSLENYVQNGLVEGTKRVTLSAAWEASVSTSDGLQAACGSEIPVVEQMVLAADIALSGTIGGSNESRKFPQSTLDLGGHTISYSAPAEDTSGGTDGSGSTSVEEASVGPALYLSGTWSVKKGSITNVNGPCLYIYGNGYLEDLSCIAENAQYAVAFSYEGDTLGQILSGHYETTNADGYAVAALGPNRDGSSIEAILAGAYTSSAEAVVDTENTLAAIRAPKLLVSQSPITYIESGSDVDLGSYVYGEAVATVEETISNEEYLPDVIITGISVDNAAFVVTGEDVPKTLLGQSTDTYGYTVSAAEGIAPGAYSGIIEVSYTKMDGTEGTYTQAVSLEISPKQLTVTGNTVPLEKDYDGTTAVEMMIGEITGVVDGDAVIVSATAVYDSADAGKDHSITIEYVLEGADKDNYLPPSKETLTGAVIQKIAGSASVTMADYHVGEKASSPVAVSDTNGTDAVTYYYKQKSDADTFYSTAVPTAEGTYTVKAVFAETTNYSETEAVADFNITYIDTPQNPYVLSGTEGSNGWYTSSVVITPAQGYLISTSEAGTFSSSYTVSASSSPVIYLQDQNGAVTKPVQVEAIRIDTVAPVISGVTDGGNYTDGSRTVQISDDGLKKVTLNGTEISFTGTTASLSVKSSAKDYVLAAEDQAGNTVSYTFHIEKSILAGGVSSLVSGEQYKLGSGSWKVKGDNTVYSGDMSFYVASDGDYEFEQQ